METNFSPRVKDVISFSREEALRLGHDYIGIEHFLLGLIREGEGVAIKILKSLNVDLVELRKYVEQSTRPNKSAKPVGNMGNIPLVKQAEKVLKITYLEAKLFQSAIIGTEHLLLSILKDENNVATRSLNHFNVDYELVKEELDQMLQKPSKPSEPKAEFPGTGASDDDEDEGQNFGRGSSSPKRPTDSKSKTPVLYNFGRDLTKLAEENRLDPIVGREKEI